MPPRLDTGAALRNGCLAACPPFPLPFPNHRPDHVPKTILTANGAQTTLPGAFCTFATVTAMAAAPGAMLKAKIVSLCPTGKGRANG
jgi:hypothetical protein